MGPPKPEFSVEGNLAGKPRRAFEHTFQRAWTTPAISIPADPDYEVGVEWLSLDTVGYHILFERAGNLDYGNFQRSTFQLLGTVCKWTFEDAYLVPRPRKDQDSIAFKRMWMEERV